MPLPCEASTESDVALRPVVVNGAHDLSVDLSVVQVVNVDPGAARIFLGDLNLCLSYGHARRPVQGVIADAADDDVHVGAFQVAAQFGYQQHQSVFVWSMGASVGVALALHPAERNGSQLGVFLQHLLILGENRLIELDFAIPVDPPSVFGIQPLLLSNGGPFLQPSADRLTTLSDLDVDDLVAFKELVGFRQEPVLRIHALHVGLP